MINRPGYRKSVLLALMLILVLGMATESRAEDSGCLDWLWPGNWFSSRTTYAPPYPGPAMVPPSTYCTPCAPAPMCCPAPCACAPQTTYRTVVDRVPVTTYMPVVTTNPCTGCATTAYRPTFTLTRQVRLIPYTTAFMGYSGGPCSTCVGMGSCVGGSCGMPGYSSMGGCSSCSSYGSAPCVGCSSCGVGDGCSSCGVAGSPGGCSSCGVAGSPGGCSSCGVPADAGAPGAVTPVPDGASAVPTLPGPVAPDQSYPGKSATPPSGSSNPPPTFAPPATPSTPSTPITPPAGSGANPPATYRNQSLPGPATQAKPIPDLGPGYRPLPLPRPAVKPSDSRTTWTPAPGGPAIRMVAATPRTATVEPAVVSSPALSTGASRPVLTEWHAARD
jgi:hypothetical protein